MSNQGKAYVLTDAEARDAALLGKGNGALELNWRGLWEPRHEDDVTVEAPTMREVIIALAAKLEEEA